MRARDFAQSVESRGHGCEAPCKSTGRGRARAEFLKNITRDADHNDTELAAVFFGP